MKKTFYAVLVAFAGLILLSGALAGSKAFAEEDGGDIVYKDTKKRGPVTFSHQKHKEAGNKCEDCHDKVFARKKGSADKDNVMTMKTLKDGKYCGACHDGNKAFTVKGSCKKCHVE